MRKARTLFNVTLPYYFSQALFVAKVILVEVLIVLVGAGVLYFSNFTVSITKNITTVDVITPVQ